MQYIRRWPVLVMFILFVVAVIDQGKSRASNYGPVNPTFGHRYSCSLSGWTTTGTVDTTTDGINCMARLTATKDMRVTPAKVTPATLEQGFILRPTDPRIRFHYGSNMGGMSFRVYDGNGTLIHQESIYSKNGSSLTLVDRQFPGYGGAYVYVVIEYKVVNGSLTGLTEQKLLVDFEITDSTYSDSPSPEPNPGGG